MIIKGGIKIAKTSSRIFKSHEYTRKELAIQINHDLTIFSATAPRYYVSRKNEFEADILMIKSFGGINLSPKDMKSMVHFYKDIIELPVLSEGYGNYDGTNLALEKMGLEFGYGMRINGEEKNLKLQTLVVML